MKINQLQSLVVIKTTNAIANKVKNTDVIFLKRLRSEIEGGLSFSEHAQDRVVQRFADDELDNLAQAISRAIRSVKTDSLSNDYIRKSVKYTDSNGIVVV